MTETNPQPSCATPVLLPTLVDGAFDYLVPQGTPTGTLVETTLAGRKLIGAVWDGQEAAPPPKKEFKLKPITRTIDSVPPLARAYREWLDWIAEFTLAPKGAVLSLCGLAHAARVTR